MVYTIHTAHTHTVTNVTNHIHYIAIMFGWLLIYMIFFPSCRIYFFIHSFRHSENNFLLSLRIFNLVCVVLKNQHSFQDFFLSKSMIVRFYQCFHLFYGRFFFIYHLIWVFDSSHCDLNCADREDHDRRPRIYTDFQISVTIIYTVRFESDLKNFLLLCFKSDILCRVFAAYCLRIPKGTTKVFKLNSFFMHYF